ncbi:sugar ABC transporter substrate-binding protein [Jiangella ureilytica]|uniref:Sugar ABC transporter substrate-binding protein n=1 Tax=Jiangella ureilytica TaxID=2530374 RepID=A0A4R4RWH5_9ACTN|nr:substrate-binding domain-containing protein [Jiangella ureilytica]TDC54538.1 sugar ABC transporter substrate-binding protein [Jiangella ureilytica]
MTRRLTAAALPVVLAFAVVASACGVVAGGDGDGYRIAFLLPENKTARYESHDRPAFVERVAEVCPECETIVSNADQDAAHQQAQAEAAITNGADVLVLDPVDSRAASVIARHADAAGIPVVSYDRLVLDAPVDFHVTFDNERVGRLQASVLLDAVGERAAGAMGSVVVLNGSPTDDNSAQFRQGARMVFEAGGVTIGSEADIPDWSPDQAQEAMERALATLGRDQVAGVYAANDGMAGGAIAAMKAAGLDPLPPVTGQDAELAAVRRILTGEQYMTVYKAVRTQARSAADLAVGLARTGEPPEGMRNSTVDNGYAQIPALMLEPVAVTRETIAGTVVADGFWSVDEICDGLAPQCAAAGLTATGPAS